MLDSEAAAILNGAGGAHSIIGKGDALLKGQSHEITILPDRGEEQISGGGGGVLLPVCRNKWYVRGA